MPIKVRLVNRIPALMASSQKKTVDHVRDASHFCQTYARMIAPVRTGALVASLYVSGPENDTDYPQSSANAISLNPLVKNSMVLEIRPQDVDSKVGPAHPVGIIAPCVPYAIFLEDGTRYMAPRPFLRPAADQTRNYFINIMADIFG